MAWEITNFWKNRWVGWFHNNPQNINKKWQPKKWIKLFIEKCEDAKIEPARKQDIEATYLSLINMTEKELLELKLDTKQPLIVQKLAEFILSSVDIDIIEKILDRWIWRPTQSVNTQMSWNIWLNPLSDKINKIKQISK